MIPYREVAKRALYEWKYKDSMEDQNEALKKAHEDAETLSFEELEPVVDAESSMNYAIEGIAKYLKEQGMELTDEEVEQYAKAIFEGPENADILKLVGEKISRLEDKDKLIIATLSNIHNGWVKKHEDNFTKVGRNKQHQHMTIELIGWGEVTSDLLFLEPILEASGVEIDKNVLESTYQESVMRYLEENGISNTADLQALIQKGEDFYPALEGQESITTRLSDPQFVADALIPIIESKGIGNIEQFISEHKRTITPSDIEKATLGVTIKGMNEREEALRGEFIQGHDNGPEK